MSDWAVIPHLRPGAGTRISQHQRLQARACQHFRRTQQLAQVAARGVWLGCQLIVGLQRPRGQQGRGGEIEYSNEESRMNR